MASPVVDEAGLGEFEAQNAVGGRPESLRVLERFAGSEVTCALCGGDRVDENVGDAELDEGHVWEAIADPATQGLGNFTMVIDLNRQSLDRVIPDVAATRLKRFFADAGWHVAEAKYGNRLTAAIGETDGDALAAHIDAMPNEAYQQLFSLAPADVRAKFLVNADPAVHRLADRYDDHDLKSLITDLGGHDLAALVRTFQSCDTEIDRPSVVFAYTIKGYGLLTEHRLDHDIELVTTLA